MSANPLPELFSRFRRTVQSGPWGYVRHPDRLRRHTRVKPLRTGGEAFPAMLAAIASAKTQLLVEMYIWRDDRTGREFRDALVARARAGVDVRVLMDALGSFGLPDAFIAAMRASGARVEHYHPVAPWRPRWGFNRRDHKKILIVDQRVGFTGGLNFGDEYRPAEDGGGGWFDWHARVEGPAVFDLAWSFRTTWLAAGGEPFERPAPPAPALGVNCLGVQVIQNDHFASRWRMHRMYLHAIRRAETSIHIMNAYFIPEIPLRRALYRAVARGVSVRIIVPGESDVGAVGHACRHLYGKLLRRGVRIFEWQESMMHAKLGVIDGVWSTIGSYNLDRRSALLNLEVGLVVIDEPLGKTLDAQFELDLAHTREVTLADVERLTLWQRFVGWFWYQLRNLL